MSERRPRRPRRDPSRPRGFDDVPELSPEEVERRVDVRGGGVPQAPAPVARPVRDLRRTGRRERNVARESLLVLGLVVVGLVTIRLVLPEDPLVASATAEPSGSAVAAGSLAPPTLGPPRTPSLQTLIPIASGSTAPATGAPTAEVSDDPPTAKPDPTPTLKPGQTPRPTPVPTKTPTPTAGPTQPNRATVIVIMNVVNNSGGSTTASDWTMKITGEVGSDVSPNYFPGSATGTSVSIPAGTPYLVSGDLATTGYGAPSISSDCKREDGSAGLPAGTTVTCTITRNDKPRVEVITNVINNDGGGASASDWSVTVTGAGASPSSFSGTAGGRIVIVEPGASYVVSMSGPSGYAESSAGSCSTSLGINDAQATCTFTFNDEPQATDLPPAPAQGFPVLIPVGIGLGGRRWWTAARSR